MYFLKVPTNKIKYIEIKVSNQNLKEIIFFTFSIVSLVLVLSSDLISFLKSKTRYNLDKSQNNIPRNYLGLI